MALLYNTTQPYLVLFELNPGLQENGLKVGQTVVIPVSKQNQKGTVAAPVNNVAKTIVVKPKETIYSITKTYNVSENQLRQWNPELKNGLKTGTTLVVGYEKNLNGASVFKITPLNKSAENTSATSKKSVNLTLANNGSTLDLVMLLPFNIDRNNFNNPQINQNLKENAF